MPVSDDALRTLRPPNTDDATYLTYIEENISKDQLESLCDILQDAELTENIGWDLVSTLLPLVPESTECLMTVAKLGNAKEVILTVTESLRNIKFEPEDGSHNEIEGISELQIQESHESCDQAPRPVVQFQLLVRMISTLYPRINAKAPSRFLSSALQAVLAAYSSIAEHHDLLTQAIVQFIKAITGTKRPHFPPRSSSSSALLTTLSIQSASWSLGANTEAPPSEEDKLQRKLLQSFVTHILDDYMQSLQVYDNIPGLAWGLRYWEKIQHSYQVANKISVTDRFSNSAELEVRLTTVGQLVAMSQDLEIHSEDLLVTILDSAPEVQGNRAEEESFPKSADSIPLSKLGSLYLFTARKAMEVLYGGASISESLPIFPGHAILTKVFIEALGEEGIKSATEPLLDAYLFHALVAIQHQEIGLALSEEQFAQYLQSTSLVSASSSFPTIRFHAHYITSVVLHSNPKDVTRFAFIQDTLQHCPFESLKGSAVGWLKEEILRANQDIINEQGEEASSLFATEIPLSTLASLLWPDISSYYDFKTTTTSKAVQNPSASFTDLMINYAFYSTSLNLLLMLLKATRLHVRLQVRKTVEESECLENFVRPLREAVAHFETTAKLEGDASAISEVAEVAELASGDMLELNVLRLVTSELEDNLEKLDWI